MKICTSCNIESSIKHGIYWHIDHIIPQFNLLYTSMEDNNFKTCWALNNLRALETTQNYYMALEEPIIKRIYKYRMWQ